MPKIINRIIVVSKWFIERHRLMKVVYPWPQATSCDLDLHIQVSAVDYHTHTHSGIGVAPIILFTVWEPKRTSNPKIDKEQTQDKLSFLERLILLVKTFIYPGMFMLCIAGGIRNAGGYVWAYNTELFFQAQGLSNNQISYYMSWIPLVGGSLGAVFGGFISDLLVKNRSSYVRIWVLIVSQVSYRQLA